MLKTNQRSKENNRVKPLLVATPLNDGESLTSWISRSALNQGVDVVTFLETYWPEKRYISIDLDRGFEFVDSQIHKDMAILADTDIDKFNSQNLIKFNLNNPSINKNKTTKAIKWTIPTSKRNRYAKNGFFFCSECMSDDKPYLKLDWRLSWAVCCTKHDRPLENHCQHCGVPYQPLLIEAKNRHLNHCYNCHNKIVFHEQINVRLPNDILEYQLIAEEVSRTGKAILFGEEVSSGEWFDFLRFLIALIKNGVNKPQFLTGRLLTSFGIKIKDTDFINVGKMFDRSDITQRTVLLKMAFNLITKSKKEWVDACHLVNATKVSFRFYNKEMVPIAFKPIFYSVKCKEVTTQKKSRNSAPVKSNKRTVLRDWNRIKRKIEVNNHYVQHLKKR